MSPLINAITNATVASVTATVKDNTESQNIILQRVNVLIYYCNLGEYSSSGIAKHMQKRSVRQRVPVLRTTTHHLPCQTDEVRHFPN